MLNIGSPNKKIFTRLEGMNGYLSFSATFNKMSLVSRFLANFAICWATASLCFPEQNLHFMMTEAATGGVL